MFVQAGWRLTALVATIFFVATPLIGLQTDETTVRGNWPQFRGPEGNGVAPEATPPVEWSDEKNLKWKTPLPGKGHSSPVVWNDRIYLMSAIDPNAPAEAATPPEADRPRDPPPGGEGRGGGGRGGGGGGGGRSAPPTSEFEFCVICLDRASGSIVWQTPVKKAVPHEGVHGTNTFASSAPVTDGKHIWVNFGSQGVHCLNADGQLVWSRDFGRMQTRNSFGEGASLALHESTLVVPWDHEEGSFITALDAATGKEIWKVDRDEVTTWSTPLVVPHGSVVQVIANGQNRIRSYNLADGKVIWECSNQASNPVPTPQLLDGVVFCMTGHRGASVQAISLDSEGDVSGADELKWVRNDMAPYVPTGTLYEGTLYYTKGNEGILTAVNAKTGETLIDAKRLDGIRMIYASLVAANGHVYISGREGATVVLRHGDKLDIAATNQLGEGINATPAIAGNQIIIRGDRHLFCFEAPPEL